MYVADLVETQSEEAGRRAGSVTGSSSAGPFAFNLQVWSNNSNNNPKLYRIDEDNPLLPKCNKNASMAQPWLCEYI